jgi:hypothetical protein
MNSRQLTLLFAGFLLSLLFDPESGDNAFVQNVGRLYQAVLCYNPEDILFILTSENLRLYAKLPKTFTCEITSFESDCAGIFYCVVWKNFGMLV